MTFIDRWIVVLKVVSGTAQSDTNFFIISMYAYVKAVLGWTGVDGHNPYRTNVITWCSHEQYM